VGKKGKRRKMKKEMKGGNWSLEKTTNQKETKKNDDKEGAKGGRQGGR